jgi:hypothetical protein
MFLMFHLFRKYHLYLKSLKSHLFQKSLMIRLFQMTQKSLMFQNYQQFRLNLLYLLSQLLQQIQLDLHLEYRHDTNIC